MTTDNRTNEPTEAQVEAAARAMWERNPRKDDPSWADLDYGIKEIWRKDARAALEAADAAVTEEQLIEAVSTALMENNEVGTSLYEEAQAVSKTVLALFRGGAK